MSATRITIYKVLIDKIQKYMVSCGCIISKQELDQFAKHYVGLDGSTTQMSNDELSDLIEGTYFLATQIGLELINPKDKNELLIQLNFTK